MGKATEQYVPVVLFITLYKTGKAMLTFQFVNKIPNWDYSNESFEQCCSFIVLFCIHIR